MKALTKMLVFSFVLGICSFFLVGQEASAKEYSISARQTIEIPMGASFPERIWHTIGDYGGYLTLVSYEKTPQNTYIGLYRGTLYLNVAPNKLDSYEGEREEKNET